MMMFGFGVEVAAEVEVDVACDPLPADVRVTGGFDIEVECDVAIDSSPAAIMSVLRNCLNLS
jgi:hypothetical protein